MNLSEIEYPKGNEYRSNREFEPIDLFIDALPCSNKLDLLLGYFSSSAINILSNGFVLFLHNGGRLRMITNHIYSAKDKAALVKGGDASPNHFQFSIEDFEKIKRSLDGYGTHFFNCIAWLLSKGRIEIKVVKPLGKKGIAHYKSGVFNDGVHQVKFDGSCNFTAYGLLENLENITVRKSFDGDSDRYSIQEFNSEFDQMFSGENTSLEYIDFKDIEEAIKDEFGDKTLQELLIQEKELIAKKRDYFKGKNRVINKLKRVEEELDKLISTPKFPFEEPRPYQVEAYKNWVENNWKGIFAMATGTGKTLTSLNCVLNEYKKSGSYRALVLVPTIELVDQWKEEIQKFKFKNIVSVSSKNKSWRNDLKRINALSKTSSSYSFFIVTTYRSFISSRFQQVMQDFPMDTIFVADEAHNCGSPSVLNLLENVPLQKRVGLSATPERVYDEEGTLEVDDFFNDTRPYTYEFSMEQALEKEYLCKYYYYPILVSLTEEELERYVEISVKLGKLFSSDDEEIKETVKRLLLARKQIIHKATNKLSHYDSLIKKLYNENQLKNTLVYAPEGYFNELFSENESFDHLNLEETRICDVYSSRIRNLAPKTKVALFNGASKNRGFILDKFAEEEIDVLVSMKCLDEGVDVPRTERAIFCASTGNPRQFIQRRGRILRNHKKKDFATIYDLVVVPSENTVVGNTDIERKLIENEFRRVQEFARLALNRHEALDEFQNVISIYNINSII